MPQRAFPDLSNVLDQPLYDTQAIATAATSVTFFAVPKGSGVSAFGAFVKTLADTNMSNQNILPNPQAMVIKAVGFVIDPVVTQADARALVRNGAVEITVGQKPYLQCPVEYCAAGMGVFGSGAQADAATETVQWQNGTPDTRAMRVLSEPILISKLENFSVTITYAAAITLVATRACRFYLMGDFYRSVQ